MKLTNALGLPEPMFRAVSRDKYDRGRSTFTVTELINPPRIRVLTKQHEDEIVEDASERLWALFGQIGHLILERAAMSEYVEKRFYARIDDKIVGGRCDLILKPDKKAKLIDYKFCSHYTVKDGIKPEWTAQINMLRFLAYENEAITIDEAEIVAIYWPESVKRGNVKEPATVFPVELWPLPKARGYIEDRIRIHLAAEKELPLCTDEERWMVPEQFALMKKGNKKASKLFDDEDKAYIATFENNQSFPRNQWYVEHRPAKYNRCERYCPVAKFCEQFHPELKEELQFQFKNGS